MRISDLVPPTLLESPQTVASITRLAWAILRIIGEKAPQQLQKIYAINPDHYRYFLDADDMHAFVFNDLPKNVISDLASEIQEFVAAMKKINMRIAFTESGRGSTKNALGWFRAASTGLQQEIILVIRNDTFKPVIEAIERNERPHDLYNAISTILRGVVSTLIHELTHAYENWTSEGRYQNNSRSIAAQNAQQELRWGNHDETKQAAAHALYLNNPIEVSARYMQAVASLEGQRLSVSWPAYKRDFMRAMVGWRNLPDTDKRRLLVRAATQWQQDQSILKHDIHGAVKRLQKRLQATIPNLWLSTSGNDSNLSVDGIMLKDVQQIAAILRPIMVLADHYGMTVALGDKLPIPAVRPLGFINQRPRSPNGGKRDYSLPLGTVYLRRPVDRRNMAA